MSMTEVPALPIPPPPAPPASEAPPAIEVRDLTRWFQAVHAVRGISFTIPRGQVVGFVGANGAGKTTTMRILATLDLPTSGEAYVGGFNVLTHPDEVRRRLGWMPDHYGTYPNMTVLDYLDFFARAYGYRGQDRIERIEEVIEFTELTPWTERLVTTLSKGMGQRLCLARALIHDPEVLILDEPAAGLDPKARVELRHLIRLLAEEGKTIFVSSHILSELGEMCHALLFLHQGRIIHYGSAADLRRGHQAKSLVEVKLAHSQDKLAEWADLAPHVTFRESTSLGGRLEIDSVEPEVLAAVLRRMVNEGLPVCEFQLQERNLEDAFIEILGESLPGGIAITPTAS